MLRPIMPALHLILLVISICYAKNYASIFDVGLTMYATVIWPMLQGYIHTIVTWLLCVLLCMAVG